MFVFPRGKLSSAEPATLRGGQEPSAQTDAPIALQGLRPHMERVATRVMEVNPLHLESERILPPGAAGIHGGPYKMLRTQVLRRLEKLAVNSLAVVGAATDTGK